MTNCNEATQLRNWKPSNTRRWSAAVARCQYPVQGVHTAARVTCTGDSTTAGYSMTPTGVQRFEANAWPGQLRAQLSRTYGYAGTGWLFHNETDPRIQWAGPWDSVPYGPFGASGRRTSGTSGASVTLSATNCTTFRVMYATADGGGVIVARVAGMPDAVVSTNAPYGIQVAEVQAGEYAPHALTLLPHPAHGSIHLIGVEAIAGTMGIRVTNMGMGSTRASGLVNNHAQGDTSLAAFDATDPDLTIIAFGANSGGQTPDEMCADTQVLIDRARTAGGDVLLNTPLWWQEVAAWQAKYHQALVDLADENDIPSLDIAARWISWADSAGLYSDNIHPNTVGYIDYAQAVRQAILTGL